MGVKTALMSHRYKLFVRRHISLVQGKSLLRAAPDPDNTSGQRIPVTLVRPSAASIAQQCDRCTGNRHRFSNTQCSATRKRDSPFTDESAWYNVHTGRRMFRGTLENETFVGRDSFGTATLVRL